MSKFSEFTLSNWTNPVSDTEDEKINHAIDMIKVAIRNDDNLKNLDYDVFVQGSYGNNTNVRINSDIDVNIMLKSTFFANYVSGKSREDYGFTKGTLMYDQYKSLIINALNRKFGSEDISLGNKSIKIKGNTYRVAADCVPSFQYRNYGAISSTNPNNFIEGIQYTANDGTEVINYPQRHREIGVKKNSETGRKYKGLVRLTKRIRNKMIEDGVSVSDNITSFLIECLIWNVPNNYIVEADSWNKRLNSALAYINKSMTDGSYKEWTEVSEMIWLFNDDRKWSHLDVYNFVVNMYLYLEQ